ncbi:methyltransferase [Ketobacter sp. MCCC 1A13808]|uniref:class I SAM-dependent methyltransferase n=1 Tax=Ketobacter sp. MCCC 1A13808 TaxID=2602738 RepID=UPI0012EB3962|nr:50S ribosomal protein L11 methyltransferase [Ketobacter sp. MCCC 1A13808]MVF10727.1 methyltransferase [Ketobacter sp. MCCC 1A13808]
MQLYEHTLPSILRGVDVTARALPLVPELKLFLLPDDYPTYNLGAEDYQRLMENPPYWAYCWGGGQALARWLLDNKRVLAGRRVVDFGAGSGVAGIAAALAGAAEVVAVDIDRDALQVCAANARLNSVQIRTESHYVPSPQSLMLAADVCYECDGFETVICHLQAGGDLLVAESRLRNLSDRWPKLTKTAEFRIRTYPDLDESERYDRVDVYSTLNV